MEKVLVDTSVLIEFLRIKTKKTIYEKILARGWRPVVSFITPAELWAGKSVWEDKKNAKSLKSLLSGVEIIFPTFATLKLSGKLRAKYNKISLLDIFIAVAAIEQGLQLITLNTKDFEKIEELEILEEIKDEIARN